MKLLSIHIDENARLWLETYAHVFQFEYHPVQNLEEALTLLSETSCDAAIITEGIDYTQIEDRVPTIALLTKKFYDAEAFRSLHEEAHLKYILPPTLDETIVVSLVEALLKGDEKPKLQVSAQIQEKYNISIYEKLLRLELLLDQMRKDPQFEHLQEIKEEVHKIAGSAGAFGYQFVTSICRETELELVSILRNTTSPIPADITHTLTQFINTLKLGFQHIQVGLERAFPQQQIVETSEEEKKKDESHQPFVYVVSEDYDLNLQFKQAGMDLHYEVIVETDPSKAIKQLESSTFTPQLLFVDSTFPSSRHTATELIKTYRRNPHNINPQIGVILSVESLEKRLELMKEEIHFILKRPVSDDAIFDTLSKQILSKAKIPFKVMILDDDPDICTLVKELLESVHIEVAVLNDPSHLLHHLRKTRPNLLLLDITLPHYNGWELLTTLRSDVYYDDLTIFIFTGDSRPETIAKAYNSGCDEIVLKPINPEIFKLKISNLTRRYLAKGTIHKIDPLTGFITRDSFYPLLANTLKHTYFTPHGALLLIQILNFKTLSSMFDETKIDEILLTCTSLARHHFHESLLSGFAGGGQLAFLFQHAVSDEIEIEVERYFEEVRSRIDFKAEERKYFELNAGICIFDEVTKNSETLLTSARNALRKTESIPGYAVAIERIESTQQKKTAVPRVIIADSDEMMSDILVQAFSHQGVEAKAFLNGQDTLNYFANISSFKKTHILFIDRSLPDVDGIEIVRTVRNKFGNSIIPIFLTHIATEMDIAEGYHAGAVDYISKPFSTKLLILKAKQILKLA